MHSYVLSEHQRRLDLPGDGLSSFLLDTFQKQALRLSFLQHPMLFVFSTVGIYSNTGQQQLLQLRILKKLL